MKDEYTLKSIMRPEHKRVMSLTIEADGKTTMSMSNLSDNELYHMIATMIMGAAKQKGIDPMIVMGESANRAIVMNDSDEMWRKKDK